MSLTATDEALALADLHQGLHASQPWGAFLARVQQRCVADAASVLIADGEAPDAAPLAWCSASSAVSFDIAILSALRPLRVYAFDEIGGETRRFGRIVKVAAGDTCWAWLFVERSAGDFVAADSAFLSALAPHLAIAACNFVLMERIRGQHAVATDLLQRAGIEWRVAHGGTPQAPMVRRVSHDAQADTLVLPGPRSGAITVTRTQREANAHQLSCLAQLWGLTPSEARFAATVAQGKSLQEAAVALDLTLETARHYSKRLYAKTGARGLPDLVRLVLTSVAALA